MTFRDATQSDIVAIANLHAESWRVNYRGILSDEYLDIRAHQERLGAWRQKFAGDAGKPMFVVITGTKEQLEGFSCVFPGQDSHWGSYLENLHVAPHLTGRGIGRHLLSETARRILENAHSGLYLWALERNYGARRFYERAGAIAAGSEEHLMPDGQRLVAMRYHWPDPATLVL
jgi:ribosomal protein S18 acetylase RimI-like enzyme